MQRRNDSKLLEDLAAAFQRAVDRAVALREDELRIEAEAKVRAAIGGLFGTPTTGKRRRKPAKRGRSATGQNRPAATAPRVAPTKPTKPKSPPKAVAAPRARRQYLCGNCRTPGHTARTCPESDDEEGLAPVREIARAPIAPPPMPVPVRPQRRDRIARLVERTPTGRLTPAELSRRAIAEARRPSRAPARQPDEDQAEVAAPDPVDLATLPTTSFGLG